MKFRVFPPLRRIKTYLVTLVAVLLVKLPWVSFFYEDGKATLIGAAKKDILSRRAYLISKVIGFKGDILGAMPSTLPMQFKGEWGLVTYSMLSSALTNISLIYPETREESLEVVRELINRTLSTSVKSFDTERWGEDPITSLQGPRGHIGYLGHLHWMIGAYKFLGGDDEFTGLFSDIASAFIRRLDSSSGLCLETYPNEIYLPDNLVVIASLANYSRFNRGVYQDVINAWTKHAKYNWIGNSSKLLTFHLDSSCKPLGNVRGSGSGWNSFYLPYIDETFATEQYEALRAELLQTRMITGLREYPKGVFGLGDVDSGPVLLGFSPSGTGFLIGGASHAKDIKLLNSLLLTAEIVGSSFEWDNKRRYLLAPVIGDAIILAMRTARTWPLP